ncbi:peptidoglycan DD-metalloendopeptidase family protein [Chitinibacter sp. ZOR0017]|uniref:peptidoglycan DD-metalloendopeptidase family protein n=1 Tax=Chitinibacter sp. ZOR0017 TaxID=1339254 RepID=UPI000648CA5E|nr:peptidoglycan DD-metalloendopeptidase family protein [Chitinibacter sp. ZOR0017]
MRRWSWGIGLQRLVLLVLTSILLACGTSSAPISTGPTPKGFYRVQGGDTLFRIAKNHGLSVDQLKRLNQLSSNDIEVGQLLKVSGGEPTSRPGTSSRPVFTATPAPAATPRPVLNLRWPHNGNVIANYAPPRNKGIDLAGNEGEPILAAADGKVVYAGDGIRAYGHMIIIRHAGDLLTTYAHNQTLLVTEGTQVKQGQPIARMGRTGTDRVKLHFEVRINGKPVNPLEQLPAR